VDYFSLLRELIVFFMGGTKSEKSVPLSESRGNSIGVHLGLNVSSISAGELLDATEKSQLGALLEILSPTARDLPGVEVYVDPNQLSASGSPSESDRPASSNGGIDKLLAEIRQKLAESHDDSFVWAGRLALKPLGERALSEVVKTSAQNGQAGVAGAALAALDDVLRYPHGPDREKIAEVVSDLVQGAGDEALQRVQTFANSYNRVQKELLSIRGVGGALGGKRTLLDLTVLFKKSPSADERARQSETWSALAGALSALGQKENSSFAFIVRDHAVSRKQVQAVLQKALPSWDIMPHFDGQSLILASENESLQGVFKDDKFSFGAFREARGSWKGPVQLVGFTSDSLVENETTLNLWGVSLIPISALIGKEIIRIIQKLEFVRVSA
jgi:hypothetical protein